MEATIELQCVALKNPVFVAIDRTGKQAACFKRLRQVCFTLSRRGLEQYADGFSCGLADIGFTCRRHD